MSGVDEREKLLDETVRRLEDVASRGDILEVARDSARPDVALLTFRGKGLAPSMTAGEKFVEGNEWRCELRFPFHYPARPPEVRWRTEIYHPNVPLSGWMSMDDLAMTWSPDAPLDSLCERLWDLIRYAYVDLDQTANFNAREWYASQTPGRFPLDVRSLSIAAKRKHDNVIHYRRVVERPDRSVSRTLEPTAPPATPLSPAPVNPAFAEPEVTFLGEVSAPRRSSPRPIADVSPTAPASPAATVSETVERNSADTMVEQGSRIFEIRAPESSEPATIPAQEASALPTRGRPALRPLPPPEPDEGIVFLD